MLFVWDWSHGDTGRDPWKYQNPEGFQTQWPETSGTLWLVPEREKKELGMCWSFLPLSIFLCFSLSFSFPNADVLCLQMCLAPTFSCISYSQPCIEFLWFYSGKVLEKVLSSPVHLCGAWAVSLFSFQCKEGWGQQAPSRLEHTTVLVLP